MTFRVLPHLPAIDIVPAGRVTQVPDWYGDLVGDSFDVRSFVIHHPDGAIVVDAGIGSDSEMIDRLYAPETVDIEDALASYGVELKHVQALVLTHLHFDHCGQARRFTAPAFVQRSELEAASAPGYTVPEWIPDGDVRLVDGDADIAAGVRVLVTPGHTPGHQSVVVEAADGRAVIVGQVCYRARDFAASEPVPDCDDEALSVARSSIDRLKALAPATFYFSHDIEQIAASGQEEVRVRLPVGQPCDPSL